MAGAAVEDLASVLEDVVAGAEAVVVDVAGADVVVVAGCDEAGAAAPPKRPPPLAGLSFAVEELWFPKRDDVAGVVVVVALVEGVVDLLPNRPPELGAVVAAGVVDEAALPKSPPPVVAAGVDVAVADVAGVDVAGLAPNKPPDDAAAGWVVEVESLLPKRLPDDVVAAGCVVEVESLLPKRLPDEVVAAGFWPNKPPPVDWVPAVEVLPKREAPEVAGWPEEAA